MFQQVPMVEIDGMKLVQTRAILNYIASKYNLYGKDMKERALIDMYTEGLADLDDIVLHQPYIPREEKEGNLAKIKDKARNRYFPAYEKVLKSHGQDYLVGNRLSKADVYLVELLYHVEELDPTIMANFPLLKDFKVRISQVPTVNRFPHPGSQRKPPLDDESIGTAKNIFKFEQGMFLKHMSTIVAEYYTHRGPSDSVNTSHCVCINNQENILEAMSVKK
uniref:Glutathione S-transferase n=1 Tax=Peromyscus maniculatus bairdii TaxID=230844 RepID=A0A8C8TIP3_PERMB